MRSVTCCLLKKGVPNTPGPKLITGAQYLRVTMPSKQGWPYLCIAVNEKSGWISCSSHRLLSSPSLICFARVGNEAHLHWKRSKHTEIVQPEPPQWYARLLQRSVHLQVHGGAVPYRQTCQIGMAFLVFINLSFNG